MDSFEINKILGAFLFTCLCLLSLNIGAEAVFHPAKPAKPGFEVAATEAAGGAETGPAKEPAEPIEKLLASATVDKGANSAKKCAACHTFGKGEPNRVGPNLYGVVGRPKATEAGFDYSPALKSKGGNWTVDDLSAFLTNPRAYAPGTKMSFAGLPRSSGAALVAPAVIIDPFGNGARADDKVWRHGLSLFGELKYSAGFKQFDYVNPKAPKGGTVRLGGFGTFDNFNIVVSGVKGTIAAGINEIYDTLMVPASDEVSTEYGLLAEAVSHPPDFSSVTYRLRVEAKWHDGKPVTTDDVIFSLQAFQKNHPILSAYYRHVVKAEQTAERDITFTFDGPGNRELPQIVGQLNLLPKHWWEGTDASGKKRDVAATTLEPPLGSGAYWIKEFVAGRTIAFERVKEYWGKDLNVNIGRDNFDEMRFEYFRDSTVALEAFKGDALD